MADDTKSFKAEPVDETALKAIISMELENALGVDGGKLSNQRRDALKQYDGEPYGNEVDGRSQVVDRTILETVEWIMPALMRIFTSSDQIVEVEPQLQQDEPQAREKTMYANYIFTRDNDGFLLLYTWFKDALLQKLGWVEADWNIERRIENEKFTGLTEEQYQALTEDPDIEEVECISYPAFGPAVGLAHGIETRRGAEDFLRGEPPSPLQPSPPLSPESMPLAAPPTLYDATFRRTINEGRVRLLNVAPEEVLISRRATPTNVPFLCRKTLRTRSELLEAGYDYDTVMAIGPFDGQEYNTERVQRYQPNDEWPYRSARTDPSAVEVWVYFCYLSVDMEGDGINKLRRVVVAGDTVDQILANDLIDEMPLHWATPIPQPHTLIGMSLADLVSDLQLIKTTLWRQTLDNLYLANNPRTYVNENAVTENTYDDLLTSRPGGLVRGLGPAAEAVTPFATPFVGQAAMQMLSYIDECGEKRTGISKGNQGIAPDDLNKNAAIGSMGIGMLQEAAAQRVELIARIFAEDVKKLFRAILGLVIRNQQDKRAVRISGSWTTVDPREWKTQFGLSVTVGLGTGNRDKQVGQLTQITQLQAAIVQMQKGLHGPLVGADNAFKGLSALTEAMGFKNPLRFWMDPANAPAPPPPQPDPIVQTAQIKAQWEMETAKLKAQSDATLAAAEMALRERLGIAELQMKFQIEMAKLGLDNRRLELDAATARQGVDLEQAGHALKVAAATHKAATDIAATMPVPDHAGALPQGPQLG